jgi:hypothetical protein
MRWICIGCSLTIVWSCLAAAAQNAADDAYAARDICVGVAANFANLPPGSKGSFNAGKFRLDLDSGRVTVFEGAVPVGQIAQFDFKSYTSCIDNTMKTFNERRK